MTVSLKHTFQSAKTDGADSALVQPSNWNAEHTLTAAAGKVLGRDTSADGAAQELPIAVTPAGNVGLGTSTPGQKLSVVGTVESTSGGFKFPDGTTQTTAATAGVDYPQNVQSNNYTLVLSDAGKHIYSANTGAQTITIPTNASVAFAIGTLVTVVNMGTTTILLGISGVSVYANGSTTATVYPAIAPGNSVQLLKTGTNTWQGTFGTFSAVPIPYLSVAGGGGGGAPVGGGGGGAGGLVSGSISLTSGTLTVTVGAGGAAGVYTGAASTAGSNSSLTGGTTAIGGGYGGGGYGPAGTPPSTDGGAGGSGGGGGGSPTGNTLGGAGTSGQGFAGGKSTATNYVGGGGGGASAVGADGVSNSILGNGGAGLASSITGSSVTYAGGGGGGAYSATTAATGGAGGGGQGATFSANATAGTANTGGGGGGGGYFSPIRLAGAGGSGVVIISSPVAATSTTGSPTITTVGANTVYKFTSSGTITW